MNRDDFLGHVNDARQKDPVWFNLPSDEPADDELLAETERRLGAVLPDDFRWFLQELGGGDFAFGTLYSADPESDLDLVRNQPEEPPGVVAFSDDGTGNVFVFPVDGGACRDRVLVLDHETGELRPTAHESFLEFVVRVALQASHG